MMFFYNFLLCLGAAAALPALPLLLIRFRKRRETVLQRLGLTGLPPAGLACEKRIWVHALSVGEVISSIPLVRALQDAYPGWDIYFSASTLTGFETARGEFRDGVAAVFYFPYDLIFSVKRIIRAVKPDAMVIVETDLWPNFLTEMDRRKIPVLLVNTRLSNRSFAGYGRFRFFVAPVFSKLTRICAQTSVDADRFRRLGIPAEKILVTGNVKFDNPVDRVTEAEAREFRRRYGVKPDQRILVAGSTHEGEERIILDAFVSLRKSFVNLFLILAPRDPDRARKVCYMARGFSLSAATLTEVEAGESKDGCEVLAVDRIGLLKRLYGLGEAAFVGGSLVERGGHNPLEPAAQGKPVLFGPHATDFFEICRLLLEGGGAVQARDGEDLRETLADLLSNPVKAREMGARGRRVFEQNKGSVDRTLAVIREHMPP